VRPINAVAVGQAAHRGLSKVQISAVVCRALTLRPAARGVRERDAASAIGWLASYVGPVPGVLERRMDPDPLMVDRT